MEYENIKFERPRDHVALITLNRPAAANALSRALFVELTDAIERIASDDDIHTYLITGAPRPDGSPWFSAGADMKEPAVLGLDPNQPPGRTVLARRVIARIDEMLKPSIAMIDGFCTTGALELVTAFDIRIASTRAQFCDWHLKTIGNPLGGWGGGVRLARIVGVPMATELLLTGAVIDGIEAERIGLVNHAVDHTELLSRGLRIAESIASMHADGVRLALGFFALQADMDKNQALRWAESAPEIMGINQIFSDFEQRFTDRER